MNPGKMTSGKMNPGKMNPGKTTSGEMIPMLDLRRELDELGDEIRAAMERVLRSGRFILGPEVEAFEAEAAAYLGVRHAVGVNSGTDALVIALRALGLGPGDEVVTTPFTFFATAEAVSILGATPVFVDIEARTFNLAPALVEAAVTERTRALLPVHLFGRPAPMDDLGQMAERHGLAIVEDTAQAFGSTLGGRRLGTLGTLGAFSFFPSKNLGAYGDGGLIATDDDALAEAARMLRAHGSRRKYHNETLGYNSRLDAMQAAILRAKLPRVDAWNEARRAAALRYDEALAGVEGLILPEPAEGHVYHQYTVRVLGGRREAVQEALRAAGVASMVYYPVPVHRLPVYTASAPSLPVSERLASEVLSLPMGPFLREEEQGRVVEALLAALR